MVSAIAERTTAAQARPNAKQRPFHPYGAAHTLLFATTSEIVLAGPAGTGKSRACLEKVYICACNYPGMRALICRKTRASLTQTAMVTWETKVLPLVTPVQFATQDQEYRFPNGSVVVVGGLDKASKIMSTEYDMIYVQEATELSEHDWESLTTRLRNGIMPYQQLIADCNPDAPTHWLRKRADRGATLMVASRHEDNPTVTADYLSKLDALTGVRYLRLRLGQWAAAEGMVYEAWDRAVNIIDRFEIPADWPRYRVVDFGYTNPFVCLWAAQDNDGRLYIYRELYGTQRLVEDWTREIVTLSEGERIEATFADHDAEDRATMERYGVRTIRAIKDVSAGVQSVQTRLRKAGDGKPRLYVFRDALVRRDAALDEAKKPCGLIEEIDGYVWQKTQDGKASKEEPEKVDDHSCDALRYLCHTLDSRNLKPRNYGKVYR